MLILESGRCHPHLFCQPHVLILESDWIERRRFCMQRIASLTHSSVHVCSDPREQSSWRESRMQLVCIFVHVSGRGAFLSWPAFIRSNGDCSGGGGGPNIPEAGGYPPPPFSVAELQEVIEDFLNESRSRNLRQLLLKGMQGHSGNVHGKPKSLRAVHRLFEGLASLAHSSCTCSCTFL